ncbi:MAG: lysophospholipid acyltransferase family protein [Elusimicrobia bacterium]|nr:lysophospholipid acyltransferase family protein [Elusimicrobiota bacterium]
MSAKFQFVLEYAAVRLLSWAVGLLPWSWLPGVASVASRAVSVLVAGRRGIAARNLALAFPEASPSERRLWEVEFWKNITLVVLEMLRMPGPCEEWIRDNIIFDNKEVMDLAMAQGRGVIIHTAHFDNWEMAGLALSLAGYPVAVVGKVQKNPYLNAWHNGSRSRFGLTVISHRQAVRQTQDHLAAGGVLAILMDQNLYKGGVFVKFFSHWAATSTLTAFLFFKMKCPMIGIYMYRKDGNHHIRFEQVAWPEEQAALTKIQRTYRLTQYLTSLLESWIRRDPSNWLWGHNRWKRGHEATAAIIAEQSGELEFARDSEGMANVSK